MEHPRWGLIMSVQSIGPIKSGQEIFTYYGYPRGEPPNDYPWYFEILDQIVEDKKAKIDPDRAKKQKKRKTASNPK